MCEHPWCTAGAADMSWAGRALQRLRLVEKVKERLGTERRPRQKGNFRTLRALEARRTPRGSGAMCQDRLCPEPSWGLPDRASHGAKSASSALIPLLVTGGNAPWRGMGWSGERWFPMWRSEDSSQESLLPYRSLGTTLGASGSSSPRLVVSSFPH